jgi:nitrile hydratase
MDGVHDMGGMHGFGKVAPEQNEPVFHDDWERRLYALYRAISRPLNRIWSRHERS